jgi:hypothetical protein
MTFPVGTSLFTNFVQPQDGRYTLNVNVANEQLEAGTTYYYIINVFNDNRNDLKRGREQEVGEFITLSQTVKVVWDTIFIMNDSDDGGDGEISLWFWINYGQPGARWLIVNKLANNSASTGESYAIEHPPNEYVIENAPHDLSLSVSAIEDDTTPFSQVARGTGISEPLTSAGSDKNYDWNVAQKTFDLTLYPTELGQTRTESFTLVSIPYGNLTFQVHGRFEITRRAQ